MALSKFFKKKFSLYSVKCLIKQNVIGFREIVIYKHLEEIYFSCSNMFLLK